VDKCSEYWKHQWPPSHCHCVLDDLQLC